MYRKRKPRREQEPTHYELEVIPGLAQFARTELQEQTGHTPQLLPIERQDRVPFLWRGDARYLLRLQRAVAIHRVQRFDIPRPKALLGHQNFQALVGLIDEAVALYPPGSFDTFYVSAAGSSSPVFGRIKDEIQMHTGLACSKETGDLLLAVRRAAQGWEVVVRLSPRPLSARAWRVCDMPGALNATVASTMMSLMHPSPGDRVVNLACGSGTLLIERLALGPVQGAMGCDTDAGALTCAQTNLAAAGSSDAVQLVQCDAGQTPLPDGWATAACADLPFGMLVGTQKSNERLYPRILREAARLVRSQGWLTVITHQVRLFERVAAAQADRWAESQVIPLKLPANTRDGYIRPRIFLLHRR